MSLLVIILIVIAVIVIYIFSTYNWFVRTRTRIEASVQEIGNQLKRQADLIPNLVSSVRGYMKHEKHVFDKLTEARKAVVQAVESGNAQKMLDANQLATRALAPIRAVFESTPQLRAAGPTTRLMDELRDTADKIMYARRTLIDLTADFNVRVATVPSALVASIFSFKKQPGLKMPEGAEESATTVKAEELRTPKVEL